MHDYVLLHYTSLVLGTEYVVILTENDHDMANIQLFRNPGFVLDSTSEISTGSDILPVYTALLKQGGVI